MELNWGTGYDGVTSFEGLVRQGGAVDANDRPKQDGNIVEERIAERKVTS